MLLQLTGTTFYVLIKTKMELSGNEHLRSVCPKKKDCCNAKYLIPAVKWWKFCNVVGLFFPSKSFKISLGNMASWTP